MSLLLNPKQNKIVSSLSWVDGAGLLVIDVNERRERRVELGEGRYVTLKPGRENYFAAVRHLPGAECVVISVHSFDSPEKALAEATVTATSLHLKGDRELWKLVPRYYVENLSHDLDGNDYFLIDIDVERVDGFFPRMEWFDDSYDKLDQSILDVIEVPGTNYLLFSVQRDSRPVLYDKRIHKVVRKIDLTNRAGNPVFIARQGNLWGVDYDTLVKLGVEGFQVSAAKRLQRPVRGMKKFIGEPALTPNGVYCAVPRPFSRDVLLLRSSSLEAVSRSRSRFQPFRVAVLSDLRYVCRDWKSGSVEYGRFSRIPFRRWFLSGKTASSLPVASKGQ